MIRDKRHGQTWCAECHRMTFFRLKTLQIRMSQAYRMGFQDIARSAAVSRLFIQKHFLAATGEDQDHKRQLRAAMEMEGRWEVEFAKIKANLTANGIKWNDTSQPFITVDGTAQVAKGVCLLLITINL